MDRLENYPREVKELAGGSSCRALALSRCSRRSRDLLGIVIGFGVGLALDIWLSDETLFELVARIAHGLGG